jgi:sulfur relay (sulfurtransferase) DsrC/TusE family protein
MNRPDKALTITIPQIDEWTGDDLGTITITAELAYSMTARRIQWEIVEFNLNTQPYKYDLAPMPMKKFIHQLGRSALNAQRLQQLLDEDPDFDYVRDYYRDEIDRDRQHHEWATA